MENKLSGNYLSHDVKGRDEVIPPSIKDALDSAEKASNLFCFL